MSIDNDIGSIISQIKIIGGYMSETGIEEAIEEIKLLNPLLAESPSGALINHEHGCVTVRTEKGFLLWMGTAGGQNDFTGMVESVIDNNKK